MSKFTNGLLRSNIHRVVSAPGQQANVSIYSVVYFSRPEDEVLLKRLDGSDIISPLKEGEVEEDVMSKEWVIRRALGIRVGGNVDPQWSASKGTEDGRFWSLEAWNMFVCGYTIRLLESFVKYIPTCISISLIMAVADTSSSI